jgi:hypothetical protein
MENNSTQPNRNSASGSQSKEQISAHDLVNKKIEDENFRVSEEQFTNIDTSVTLTPSDENGANELADNLDRDGAGNSAETIGK